MYSMCRAVLPFYSNIYIFVLFVEYTYGIVEWLRLPPHGVCAIIGWWVSPARINAEDDTEIVAVLEEKGAPQWMHNTCGTAIPSHQRCPSACLSISGAHVIAVMWRGVLPSHNSIYVPSERKCTHSTVILIIDMIWISGIVEWLRCPPHWVYAIVGWWYFPARINGEDGGRGDDMNFLSLFLFVCVV